MPTIRAAFTYEPFLSSKKSIATHHARQRSSILQHEIPHSRMLVRPYGHSQTPICPGIWGINSSRGNSIRYLLEVLQKQRWRQQLASQLSTMEGTVDTEVKSHSIYYCCSVNFEWHFFFIQSWIFDVVFFSCNSKIFIMLPPFQLFHIHAGSSMEKILEVEN